MALYIDEEDVWKCPKHPTKRRRTGICHVCLRERLSSLCPDCANVRPCSCCAATTSTSSSSSSSFSRFSAAAASESYASGIGTVGRVSNLIESEPSFRRSRSLAVPFLRSSKPSIDHDCSNHSKDSPKTTSPFWSLFKSTGSSGNRSNRGDVERQNVLEQQESKKNEEERRRMMRKSRSVAVAVTSDSVGADIKPSKGKGWYFPSPIKAFKQSISRGIMVQERSPLYRG
ncbi:hypothetical protein JCGZ_18613 [Jatropha curcas]|uniref:Uncharacterized protein n=1 Tax=Jatropha curcas TaxID=180498 RepID=A0A067K1M3_JATCU|nr:uncharacterized protein LOC105641396 [Jatropha curcas]KDP30037.1 hypothetical protein JCGZ_18613 [Jatropha curcas]